MDEEATLYWKSQGQIHKQLQLQKPTLAQLMSQRFSCELLFNLLSSGEKCIHHYHKERKYRYYDPLTTAKTKNQDELELEFRNQLRCFQACFIDDIENGGFRYPDNLNRQAIIEDVKGWMKYAKMGYRDILYQTYEKFITLLEKEKQIYVDKIKTINSNDPDVISKGIFKGVHKKETNNFITAGMLSNKEAFEMESKIKQDYLKGDYSIKANLYLDPPKQKNIFEKIGEKIKYTGEEYLDKFYNFDNK